MRSPAISNLTVVIQTSEIRSKVRELAGAIADYYGSDLPLFVGILSGSAIFLADLIREIPDSVEIEFMALSSYGDGMSSSGAVQILKDLDSDISGKRILIVEDIVDTGTTVNFLLQTLGARSPSDVRVATLLRKPKAREEGTKADWVGFDIEDRFVVGYGLDYAGAYRNLPYIADLQPD